MGNRETDLGIATLVWIGYSNSVAFPSAIDAARWCVEPVECAACAAALTKLSFVFHRLALEHRAVKWFKHVKFDN